MDITVTTPAPAKPPTLQQLVQDIRLARRDVSLLRTAPVNQPDLLSARQTLLRALESYADELSVRRLPIPRQLRDDLRLQREIGRQRDSRLVVRLSPRP